VTEATATIRPGEGAGRAADEWRARLLRRALKLDAVASGTLGVLALIAAPVLEGPLGVPRAVLWPVALLVVAYAAFVWMVASAPSVSRTGAWAAVGLNALWVAGSVAVVVAGWLPLTVLGTVVVLAQAIAVAILAELQLLGLGRAR
jgi:hypothetical protein